METLILLRHAKAVGERDAASDRARPLAPRGQEEARAAGLAFAARKIAADAALVSAAARTRETWALVSPFLGDPPAAFREALYMADAQTIWREAIASGARRVIVVGHNPGLHELAVRLVRQARAQTRPALGVLDQMAPAAWAAFAIGEPRIEAARPALLDAWSPKLG